MRPHIALSPEQRDEARASVTRFAARLDLEARLQVEASLAALA